jgi:hypothetical protein
MFLPPDPEEDSHKKNENSQWPNDLAVLIFVERWEEREK